MIDIRTAAPFARRFHGQVVVIKVGGACLERPGLRKRIAADIAVVHGLGARVVVVHGAGPQVDALQRSLGEEPRKVSGRRITSPLALRALRQATLGELNGELAALITAAGASAVGLCAGSAKILEATRRPPVVTAEGTVDFGHVGDIKSCDPTALWALLDRGIVPVLSPPAGDGSGGFLNVNADLAAAHLAVALSARKLLLCTSTPGILTDANDPSSLTSTLDLAQLAELEAKGVLRDGMAVKARAITMALEGGVLRVHVVSGTSEDGLLGELYTTHGTGTLVTAGNETNTAATADTAVPVDLPTAGAPA
ncbi:MAG: acetylglutamate kinase [Planctomycetota bacterium]|jgi:acetylglutamate kinase